MARPRSGRVVGPAPPALKTRSLSVSPIRLLLRFKNYGVSFKNSRQTNPPDICEQLGYCESFKTKTGRNFADDHKIMHQVRILQLLFAQTMFSKGRMFTNLKCSEKMTKRDRRLGQSSDCLF